MCVNVHICECVCVRARILELSLRYTGFQQGFVILGCQQCLTKVERAVGIDLWIWDIVLPAVYINCVDSLMVILI